MSLNKKLIEYVARFEIIAACIALVILEWLGIVGWNYFQQMLCSTRLEPGGLCRVHVEIEQECHIRAKIISPSPWVPTVENIVMFAIGIVLKRYANLLLKSTRLNIKLSWTFD